MLDRSWRRMTDGRKEIWLCGHSLVKWAGIQAEGRPMGRQLGIPYDVARVHWAGKGGMCWAQLLPVLCQLDRERGAPDVLFIHLGENDLVQSTGLSLLRSMKRDLEWIRNRWPRAKIVWSALLPRRIWRGARKPRAIDKARREVNREVYDFCVSKGIRPLYHEDITFNSPALFRGDGVHLSFLGN